MKLSKDDLKNRDDLVRRLTATRDSLQQAVDKFNASLTEILVVLVEKLEDYNSVVDEARGFCADIANQLMEEIGDKSEKWQESERGQQALEFHQAWENAQYELQDIELEEPSELNLPEELHSDIIENLPEDSESV